MASSSSWSASSAVANEFLTLDLGSAQTVDGVVTKGRGTAGQWVTFFTVSYSNDNIAYTPIGVTFRGNIDQNTEVTNIFPSQINARYIRIIETAYNSYPSMRADAITASANTTLNSGIAAWYDQSGNSNHATQSQTTNQPLYKNQFTEYGNFNPLLKFDGLDDRIYDPNGLFGTSSTSIANAFVVSRADATQTSSVFFESLGTGTQFNLHCPWNDANIYWDGANSSRINLAWGGVAAHFLKD